LASTTPLCLDPQALIPAFSCCVPPATQVPLETRFRKFSALTIRFMKACLAPEPSERCSCTEAMQHTYFDGFRDDFERDLEQLLAKSPPSSRRHMKKVRRECSATGCGVVPPCLSRDSSRVACRVSHVACIAVSVVQELGPQVPLPCPYDCMLAFWLRGRPLPSRCTNVRRLSRPVPDQVHPLSGTAANVGARRRDGPEKSRCWPGSRFLIPHVSEVIALNGRQ